MKHHSLRNIPFFAGLDDNILEAISRRLQREHYHKGAAVFLEDEPGDCMYVIESGQVKVISERGSQEKIFGYLGPGNLFGEMALLLGERRSATVRVVIDADLLVLHKDDFDELDIPLYIIATDLISGEEIVFDRGSVGEAVRASMSVIGVFEPAQVAGRFLIDGGSVNPVPTQLLADKGISIILASNVIPSLEDRIHRRELKREGKLPNVIGIVSGAMEIMESEIIKSRMGPVDILVSPDIARYGTMEYDKANEIIKRGEEAARAQIPAIRQRLAPNPRKRTGG